MVTHSECEISQFWRTQFSSHGAVNLNRAVMPPPLPLHVICAIVLVASGGLISARLDQYKGYQIKTTANSNSVAWGEGVSTASLQCLTKKREETISPVPKKIVQIPVEVPVEQSISSILEEEELKSNDTTSVVA